MKTRNNFYIYVDREGKMPALRRSRQCIKSHPYWIRYVDNKPVEAVWPEEKVWDYSINEFVTIPKGALAYG